MLSQIKHTPGDTRVPAGLPTVVNGLSSLPSKPSNPGAILDAPLPSTALVRVA